MGFFKAYDMRGTWGVDFDADTAYGVGRLLPMVVGGGRWLVARDCRASSRTIREALAAGLEDAACDVTDLGLASTPMTYFFTGEEHYDGSVMITASHNPPTDNGMKVSRRGCLPVGYATGLAELEEKVRQCAWKLPRKTPHVWRTTLREESDAARLAQYVAWLRDRGGDCAGLRFAVDCSDGMSGLFAHEVFAGAEAFLNDAPDGAFPHHAPNPLLAAAREQMAACVHERGLDCGLVFDGDADRCVFVDETGAMIRPDLLVPVIAGVTAHRGDTVICDVRTGRGVWERLERDGFTPRFVPVGHANAKAKLREYGAVCGGEYAGHYYFREFHGCDSGALAALRILAAFAAAKRRGISVSALMAEVSGGWCNSGEVNFKVADKDAAIATMLARAPQLGIVLRTETMDGHRLEFEDGWVSIRKSNTEPYLRLLVEFRSVDRMRAAVELLTPETKERAV